MFAIWTSTALGKSRQTNNFFPSYNNKLFSFYVAATGSNATVGATDWILPIVYYDYRFVLGRIYRHGRKSGITLFSRFAMIKYHFVTRLFTTLQVLGDFEKMSYREHIVFQCDQFGFQWIF